MYNTLNVLIKYAFSRIFGQFECTDLGGWPSKNKQNILIFWNIIQMTLRCLNVKKLFKPAVYNLILLTAAGVNWCMSLPWRSSYSICLLSRQIELSHWEIEHDMWIYLPLHSWGWSFPTFVFLGLIIESSEIQSELAI